MAYARGAAIPPDASAHVRECARCSGLVRALGATNPIVEPPIDLLQRIAASVTADLKPVKPMAPEWARFLALMVALALVAAVGASALGTAGWQALGEWQRLVIFSTLGAGAGMLAFSVGRQVVPGSRLALSPGLLVAAVLGITAGIFAGLFRSHEEATFVATGLVCFRIGLECAIPAGVVFWMILRRGAALDPALTGATAGALAGFSGLTVLETFCPNLNIYHVLVWHLGGTLASAIGGLALGSVAEYFTRRIRAKPRHSAD